MIASGLFVVPGIGFELTGQSLFLAFIAAAIAILPAAVSKAELATAMPTSGGAYVYIERTFGPLAGTVSGLGLYLSILLKVAFALVGLGAYISVFSNINIGPTLHICVAAIVLLNIGGIGKVSSLLTTILAITIVSTVGMVVASEFQFDKQNLLPLFGQGMDGFVSATAVVFISYAGILKVAAIAEEVKTPEKTIPQGILLSLLVAAILYSGCALAMALIAPSSEFASSMKPMHDWAAALGIEWIATGIAIVAILTIINSSNAGVLAGSRFPFAMSRDNLLPSFLGELHPKFLTPVSSIILSGGIISLAIAMLDIAKIAKLASAFMILIYMLENLCVIVLRETQPQWYKPSYKAPLYPALQLFGIFSGGLFLYSMGMISVLAVAAIGVPGILFYAFYSRNKTTRKGVVGIKGKRQDIIDKAFTPTYVNVDFHKTNIRSQVVVGLFGKERSPDMLIEMGLTLAEKGQVEVASLIEVPEQTTLQDVIEEPPQIRSLRRRALAMTSGEGQSIHFDSVVTHDLSHSIFEISQCVHCDWLLIEWQGKKRGSFTFHDPMSWLKSHLHCNMAIFRDTGIRYIRKILVLLNNDKNDKVILETIKHLASVYGARVILAKHVSSDLDEASLENEKSKVEAAAKSISDTIEAELIIGDSRVHDVVAETVNFDLFVLGSQDHSPLSSFVGTDDNRMIAKANCSVLAVHASLFAN